MYGLCKNADYWRSKKKKKKNKLSVDVTSLIEA